MSSGSGPVVLITGGAGFIGGNAARAFSTDGDFDKVVVFDNLMRQSARGTVESLQRDLPNLEFVYGDLADAHQVDDAIREYRPDLILHLAAQVAVTHSVRNPRWDFGANALGTLNLLEAVRVHAPDSALIYASTNKVYGTLEDVPVRLDGDRYRCDALPHGVDETRPLDFHTPYGCSKGAADQYVLDYARTFGLRTVSFRQSCIYGPGQCGEEDQGWVAWFCLAAVSDQPITVFGDGHQVRDVLYVDDLVEAYRLAAEQIDDISGAAYNIGGGPSNAWSLRQLLAYLSDALDKDIPFALKPPRPGDQRVFVCDVRRAGEHFGWRPKVAPDEGVKRLLDWVHDTRAAHAMMPRDPVGS